MRFLLLLTFLVFLPFSSLAETKEGEVAEEQKSAEEQSRTVAEDPKATAEQDSAEAQEEQSPTAVDQKASSDYEGDVEKLEVIGSHIKRTTTEGPSPVLVIDREQINMSGYTSLSDVLRDLPVASLGGQRATSLNSIQHQTGTSLRGIKSNNILVLVNGARLSPVGGGSAVDLQTIPISVIERVEILKEATPLYGSDAIGGVINIITKSDYAGGEISVSGSLVQRVEGNSLDGFASFLDFWNWDDTGHSSVDNSWAGKGDTLSVDASYGGSKNDINYIVGGQVRFDAPMYLRDRSFGKPKVEHMSPTGSPGSWKEEGLWNPSPGCPSNNIREVSPSEGNKCYYDYSPFMQFTPQILQTSGFFQVSKDIDDMTLFGRAIYNYTRSHAVLAPAPDGMKISMELAQKMGFPAQSDVVFAHRLVEETGSGPRESIINQHFYQVQLGAIKPFLNTLELDLELNISGSHYFSTGKNYAIKDKPDPDAEDEKISKSVRREALKLMEEEGKTDLTTLLNEGKWNPIADKKGDISKATYAPFTNTHSNVISFEPKITGEIIDIGEKSPLMFALGATATWQNYNVNSDPITNSGLQWGGGVVSEGSGDRLSSGLYGELSSIFAEMIEVQLGARADYYYSDVGFSGFAMQDMFDGELSLPFSPRAAVSFQPIDEIKLRTSWGLGFKAPTLMSINHQEVVAHPFVIDSVQCPTLDENNTACETKQVETFLKSSPDLEPELSQSFNAGVIVEPTEGVSFGVDYYRTTQEDTIVNLSDTNSINELVRNILRYEQKHGVEKLKKLGDFDVTRNKRDDGKPGAVENIKLQLTNLANNEVQGLDFNFALTIPVEAGWDFGVSLQHSHLLYLEQQVFEELDAEVLVPYYGEDKETWYGYPRWRNRAVFSIMNKNMGHNAHVIVHNIPGQLKRPGWYNDDKKTDYYWQLDLAGTIGLTKSTRLTVGVRNIFDQERPDNTKGHGSSGYIHSAVYSIRGRAIDARLTYNFQ